MLNDEGGYASSVEDASSYLDDFLYVEAFVFKEFTEDHRVHRDIQVNLNLLIGHEPQPNPALSSSQRKRRSA